MPEEILGLDEVERVARDFIRKKWNGEVAEFQGNWPCPTEGVHEVEGKAKIPQRVATGEPKRLPNNAPFYETDVVYMDCLFKLRVSVKNREVIGYRIEQPKPPPPSSHFYPPIGPDTGTVLEEMRWEKELEERGIGDRRRKDKTDYFEELRKKYGFDEKKLGL